MTFLCENCQYTDACGPKSKHPEIVGCCDFGGFDEDGNLFYVDEGDVEE